MGHAGCCAAFMCEKELNLFCYLSEYSFYRRPMSSPEVPSADPLGMLRSRGFGSTRGVGRKKAVAFLLWRV